MEKTGQGPTRCQLCEGRGEVRKIQKSFLGQIVNVQQCLNCNGTGFIGGLDQKSATIKIQVPKGVSNGNYISIRGEGNQSHSAPDNGDLIVYFEEKEHKLFTRDGQDIYIDCYLHYHQIVTGTEIDILTLSGKIKMKIPAGINSGEILRLKGKGLPYVNSTRFGDQFVRIKVITPKKTNKRLLSALEELSLELGNDIECKKFKH